MTDHQWSELAAPYVLGALPPDERERFAAHLAECAACRGEVQALREVFQRMKSARLDRGIDYGIPVAVQPTGCSAAKSGLHKINLR